MGYIVTKVKTLKRYGVGALETGEADEDEEKEKEKRGMNELR